MKKYIQIIFILFCMVLSVGCHAANETMYQQGIMIDGIFYEKSYQPMPIEVDESAIIGFIESYAETYPQKNLQTNIDKNLIGTPYAKVEGGIAILHQNEWYLCVAAEGA